MITFHWSLIWHYTAHYNANSIAYDDYNLEGETKLLGLSLNLKCFWFDKPFMLNTKTMHFCLIIM